MLSPIPVEEFDASCGDVNEVVALPPAAFTTDAFHEFEVDAVFGHEWLCIGRATDIPNKGDYFTVDALGEQLLVVRQADGVGEGHDGAAVEDGRARAEVVADCEFCGHSVGLRSGEGHPEELGKGQHARIEVGQPVHHMYPLLVTARLSAPTAEQDFHRHLGRAAHCVAAFPRRTSSRTASRTSGARARHRSPACPHRRSMGSK